MARQSARAKRNAASVKGNWDVLPHGMGVRPAPGNQPANLVKGGERAPDSNDAGSNDSAHQPESADLVEATQSTSTLAANPITESQLSEPVTNKEADDENPPDVRVTQESQEVNQNIEEAVKEEVVTLRRSQRVRARLNAHGEDNAKQSVDPTTKPQLNGKNAKKMADKTKGSSATHISEETDEVAQTIKERVIEEKGVTLRRSKRARTQVNSEGKYNAERAIDPVAVPRLNGQVTSKAADTTKDPSDVLATEELQGATQSITEEAIQVEVVKEEVVTEDVFMEDVVKEEVIKEEAIKEDITKEDTVKEEVTTLRRSKRVRTQVNTDEYYNGEEAVAKRAKRASRKLKDENGGNGMELQPKPKRVPRKTKDNPYGLMPGNSPYPDWQAPSAAQCEEVYSILASMHGKLEQPAVIPTPSLEVAGCGEVPFVLEALLRTVLSGAVTMDGAGKMVQGIIAKYGVLQDDLAKGAIDWNKVRLSSIEDLEGAIRVGGLANRKAKSIKDTLDMVYDENISRHNAFLAEKETGVPADVYGASERTQGQKDLEILKTERNILSLDHMYGLSVDDAMREFTKFPGIGVKTAACVILFCLQRPCFAVDTHVHRFSRWLGWVPNSADENNTYCHLEVRCPDHLKYGLHQLFIKHGQTCGRCKLATVEGTKDWEAVVCPLEHLLARNKKTSKAKKKMPSSKSAKASSQEDDSESELPETDETTVDEIDEIDEKKMPSSKSAKASSQEDDSESELPETDETTVDEIDEIDEKKMPSSKSAKASSQEDDSESELPETDETTVDEIDEIDEKKMPSSKSAKASSQGDDSEPELPEADGTTADEIDEIDETDETDEI